ncbi:MAG: CDP-alcohol phosphatidyltransferase family protein [Flavobacteriaceae bacterium]|nr:CDP-alcohol phosphatidyltransferase family protein [Flavobacteriaceae bacterium]
MSIKKQIPNLFTLLNLLSGCIGAIFAVQNDFIGAAIFVALGIFFDFFDGFLARKLNVQSDLGIQLDSLADMVTSGLVPGIVMFKLIAVSTLGGEMTYSDEWNETLHLQALSNSWLPIIGLFITLASAYRLARFNIDEDQQSYFKGLPTPANALLILSLPLVLQFGHSQFVADLLINTLFLIGLTLVSCYLLNSSIKLFALKFKTYAIKPNIYRYLLLLIAIILLIWLQFAAIPLIILSYFIFSFLHYKSIKEEQ